MDFKTADDYNKYLINGNYDINFIPYMKCLKDILCPTLDISFAEKLYPLLETNECKIPHELLYEYGVLKENKKAGSQMIKSIIQQNNFEDNTDTLCVPRKILEPEMSTNIFFTLMHLKYV